MHYQNNVYRYFVITDLSQSGSLVIVIVLITISEIEKVWHIKFENCRSNLILSGQFLNISGPCD